MGAKTTALVMELRRYAEVSSLPAYLRMLLRRAADALEEYGKGD